MLHLQLMQEHLSFVAQRLVLPYGSPLLQAVHQIVSLLGDCCDGIYCGDLALRTPARESYKLAGKDLTVETLPMRLRQYEAIEERMAIMESKFAELAMHNTDTLLWFLRKGKHLLAALEDYTENASV